MTKPVVEIDADRAAHERLHATARGLDDDVMRHPSGLPGWSVGHVLTHLARNADSVVRRLHAAEHGQHVEQYPGGAAGRAAEIERGASDAATSIVEDLIGADDRVDRTFATTSMRAWDEQVAAGGGGLVAASDLAFARWREVEIHHVDLQLGYDPADWPEPFVEQMLPRVLRGLGARTDPHALLGWALGRAAAPELGPWA